MYVSRGLGRQHTVAVVVVLVHTAVALAITDRQRTQDFTS